MSSAVLDRRPGSGPRPGDRPGHRSDIPRVHRWWALVILVLAVVLLSVDATVLALAVPALSTALQPSAEQLLWIGDVYSFALAGLLVTMGGVADRIGRRRLLVMGSTAFGVASVLAAFAPSAEWLIAARVLLGVAGATLMPSTLSIIRNLFEGRQRTTAISVWSAAAAGGAALGPLVGGGLLEHFWWGSVFLINVPIIVVIVVGALLLVPESRDPRPGAFDLVSAGLSLAGVVPVVYAIKQVAGHGPSLTAGAAALVGVLALVAFVHRQRRLASPLIDVTLFSRPAFSGSIVSNLVSVFAFSGLLFFFSQYLQLVRGYSPLQAGLRELPITLASIAVIVVAGRTARRFGHGRVIGAGLYLAAAGMAGLAAAEGASSYAWTAAALVGVGLGVGFSFTLSTDAVLSSVPRERAGSASAVSETAYELGVALGIAILGSLLSVLYRSDLPDAAPAVRESLASASGTSGGAPAAALESFVHAMQVTSVTAAVLLLVAGTVAWRVIPSARVTPADRPASRAGSGSW